MAYRQNLLDLILASPTSEAKLFAGRWYRNQGNIAESEDAYHTAMTTGRFWDALDAANELIETDRYHADAVQHLLSVVRDSEYFTPRVQRAFSDCTTLRKNSSRSWVHALRNAPMVPTESSWLTS